MSALHSLEEIGFLKYGKSLPEETRVEGDYPVYSSSGVTGSHKTPLIKNPAIIIGRKGSVGTLYFSQKPSFPIDTVFYIDKVKKGYSLKYYFYFLSQIGLKEMNSDAAVPGLSRSWVHSLKANYPNPKTQLKVASILSAYDDLIKNNEQRMVLLEKMAEEIYREWFVRLRFPGYKKVKVSKGVPTGWEVKKLSSLVDEVRKSIKKKNLSNDISYVGLEHISRKSISLKNFVTADLVDSDKLLFQTGDILFSKIRPYLHKVALSHISGACSSDTIILRPKNKSYEAFILFTVFSETFIELANIAAKGTKMPRADWDFLKNIDLIVPNKNILDQYQNQFDQIFSQIVNLLKQTKLMEKSRDLLLPRLIAGKVSVEELDIQFPSSMQDEIKLLSTL